MGANVGKQSGILPSDFKFETNDGQAIESYEFNAEIGELGEVLDDT